MAASLFSFFFNYTFFKQILFINNEEQLPRYVVLYNAWPIFIGLLVSEEVFRFSFETRQGMWEGFKKKEGLFSLMQLGHWIKKLFGISLLSRKCFKSSESVIKKNKK